mmetsp:Transcript_27838/g.32109  ORF Transcript_27838/g.32109 Transcript_27838/m.32109 type:complete len:86 (+) Transcript_27838:54-311(+)
MAIVNTSPVDGGGLNAVVKKMDDDSFAMMTLTAYSGLIMDAMLGTSREWNAFSTICTDLDTKANGCDGADATAICGSKRTNLFQI